MSVPVLIVAAACATYFVARSILVAGHKRHLKAALRPEAVEPWAHNDIGTEPWTNVTAGAGVTAIDALWELHRIDDEVLEAYDAAHGTKQMTYRQLVAHVQEKFSHGPQALAGEIRRIKGYLGERHLADHLANQGHHVEMANSPNQQGWDAYVDGERVQLKAGLDPSAITQHLAQHPDIPVVTVGEHADHFASNAMVTALPDVSGAVIQETTEQTLDAIDGLDGIEADFPIVTLLVAGARNARLVARGDSDLGTALEYATSDLVGGGGGALLGAKAGGMLGMVAGPVGAAAGAVIGGILGGLAGRSASKEFKERHLRAAQDRLKSALAEYPKAYVAALGIKAESLASHARRVRPTGIRSIVWPKPSHTARRLIAQKYRVWARRCVARRASLAERLSTPVEAADPREPNAQLATELLRADQEPVSSFDTRRTRALIQRESLNVTAELKKLGRVQAASRKSSQAGASEQTA